MRVFLQTDIMMAANLWVS